MNQSVSSILVADQILWLRREIESTPMHMIKLVYLSHGWMLGLTKRSLINEAVEAWRYGPVVPSVYHRFKSFVGGRISVEVFDRSKQLDDDQRAIIEMVEDIYRNCTAIELSSLTHQPGTPWDTTRCKHGLGTIIPNELIQEHYSKLVESKR